ncbi:hypothetical protein Y032_0812g2471 [Ancylostoma ceylanicum]|uniref:Uncharacterized protein n=1 Tax=Ancylostoma ceylanicum TaxID=53326 RepID=A0A016WBN3_9BILA|nr:hypothetical protein Y032_0812g2471 [Ancylostoma ceylanicum]
MIFSCGISGSSPGRKLIVSESLPETLRSISAQTYRSSPASADSTGSSPSRSSSPAVRVEDIVTGKWTRISSRVSVRPLTPSEAESVFERQRRRRRDSSTSKGDLHGSVVNTAECTVHPLHSVIACSIRQRCLSRFLRCSIRLARVPVASH